MPLSNKYNPKETESKIYKQWMDANLGQYETQEASQKKYLIFDFDGVICDGLESDLYAEITRGKTEGVTKEESIQGFWDYFEYPKHGKNVNLTKTQLEEKNHTHQKICDLRLAHGTTKLFEGFLEEITKIPNTKLAIVSSSANRFLETVLAGTKWENTFEYLYGFDVSPSKEVKIEMILEHWGINKSQAYYFTDTKTDVIELQDYLGKGKVLGCSWGYHSTDKLKEVLESNHILREFSDIHEILGVKPTDNGTHSILMPPPNLTGNLHAGHAFQHFLMDTLSRVNRQKGKINLWYPGVDHAGIQLEGVVDKLIKKSDFDDQLKKH